MELVTVKGGVREITPDEMASALERGGRRQVDIINPQEEAGGDLIVDERTGKMIFQPSGPDPLNLRGMEVELPQGDRPIGFAFGGQPVIFSKEGEDSPKPYTIVGYSIPGGPAFNALDELQAQLRTRAAAENPENPPNRKYSFQQNGRAGAIIRNITGPPNQQQTKSGVSSPRPVVHQPLRASTGIRNVDAHLPNRGSRLAQDRKATSASLSPVVLPEKPRMLFKAGDATMTNQIYHQRLRPGQRLKPGEMCCGGRFNVARSAADALRATADWLTDSSSTAPNSASNTPPADFGRRFSSKPREQKGSNKIRSGSEIFARSKTYVEPGDVRGRADLKSDSPVMSAYAQLERSAEIIGRPRGERPSTGEPLTSPREAKRTMVFNRPSRASSAQMHPQDFRATHQARMDAATLNQRAHSPSRHPQPPTEIVHRKTSSPLIQQSRGTPVSSQNGYNGLTVEQLKNIPVVQPNLNLGGVLLPLINQEALIPGVPTRYDKPISHHPQICGFDASGKAQLKLDDGELSKLGLTSQAYQKLRAGDAQEAGEDPMVKANRMITSLRQTESRSPTIRPMTAEEEARHLKNHELVVQQALRSHATKRLDQPIRSGALPSSHELSQVVSETTSCAAAINAVANEAPVNLLYGVDGSCAPPPPPPPPPPSEQSAPRQPQGMKQYELTTESGQIRLVEKLCLNQCPQIELLRSFLSEEECNILNPKLQALDQDPQVPNNLLAATELDGNLTRWISTILNRVAQLCDCPVESIVGLCPSTITKGAIDATKDFSTIVRIYLNEHEGATSDFPELGITVRPKIGAALRWDCKDNEGRASQMAKHKEIITGDHEGRKLFTAYLI